VSLDRDPYPREKKTSMFQNKLWGHELGGYRDLTEIGLTMCLKWFHGYATLNLIGKRVAQPPSNATPCGGHTFCPRARWRPMGYSRRWTARRGGHALADRTVGEATSESNRSTLITKKMNRREINRTVGGDFDNCFEKNMLTLNLNLSTGKLGHAIKQKNYWTMEFFPSKKKETLHFMVSSFLFLMHFRDKAENIYTPALLRRAGPAFLHRKQIHK